jgi:hypothetical protein
MPQFYEYLHETMVCEKRENNWSSGPVPFVFYHLLTYKKEYTFSMSTITLPSLEKARKLSSEERFQIIAQIAEYSRDLATLEAFAIKKIKTRRVSRREENSDASFDKIFQHPKIIQKFDLLAEAVR